MITRIFTKKWELFFIISSTRHTFMVYSSQERFLLSYSILVFHGFFNHIRSQNARNKIATGNKKIMAEEASHDVLFESENPDIQGKFQ
jgi:hypothetical protein